MGNFSFQQCKISLNSLSQYQILADNNKKDICHNILNVFCSISAREQYNHEENQVCPLTRARAKRGNRQPHLLIGH